MSYRFLISIVCCLLSSLLAPASWIDDYEVAPGFRLDVGAQGFKFPTAIAFVSNPGSKPDSPLYFVTEIRGQVRVVTNDRSVHTFAENFYKLQPLVELPNEAGEIFATTSGQVA